MNAERGSAAWLFARSEQDDAECWNWTGSLNTYGYGCYYAGRRRLIYAHRASYEAFVGPIPEGMHIDHLCRNHGCINPSHLEPVTVGENIRRGVSPSALNARKSVCIRGHELVDTYKDGRRFCRICHNAARRLRRSRQEKRPRAVKPCGTRAAYIRHVRNGEAPCLGCVEANRIYQRTWDKRRTESGAA